MNFPLAAFTHNPTPDFTVISAKLRRSLIQNFITKIPLPTPLQLIYSCKDHPLLPQPTIPFQAPSPISHII